MTKKPREAFAIGVLCALSHELAACRAMLDEEYEHFEDQDPHDDNVYVCGRMQNHDIVMACLPAKTAGKASAAGVARDMLRSFPDLHFGLMVGIGGAVPDEVDIRLGDIVVSTPTGEHGGVIQYDLGKSQPGGGYEVRGHLNRPPPHLLNAVQSLQSMHEIQDPKTSEYMDSTIHKFPKMQNDYEYPGIDNDILYEVACIHGEELNCRECGSPKEIERSKRRDRNGELDKRPRVFYGLIGSGDTVIASAQARQRLQQTAPILCFEMEAAGLMNSFPCLVIRGMSDYADAHKRDDWQRYAALSAAAYAKELLQTIPPSKVSNVKQTREIPDRSASYERRNERFSNIPLQRVATYVDRPSLHLQLKGQLHDSLYETTERSQVVAVYALAGAGKTQLVLNYIQKFKNDYEGIFWINSSDEQSIERQLASIYRNFFQDPGKANQVIPPIDDLMVEINNWFLDSSRKWLWVLDSADNIENPKEPGYINIVRLIPTAACVQVMITSRSSSASKVTPLEAVQAENFEKQQALDLFWGACKIDSDNVTETNYQAAEKIVEQLGYLPLAISLAGCTICERPSLLKDLNLYLTEFQVSKDDLLQRNPDQLLNQYGASILTAWETSFASLRHRSELAANLLGFLSFLDPEDVYIDLFNLALGDTAQNEPENDTGEEKPAWQRVLSDDSTLNIKNLEAALTALRSFSFLKYNDQVERYSIHNLVHSWSYDRLDEQTRLDFGWAVGQFLQLVIRNSGSKPASKFRLVKHFLRHFQVTRKFIVQESDEERLDFLLIFLDYERCLQSLNLYAEEEEMRKFHYDQRRQIQGDEHEDTLAARIRLARVVLKQRKVETAMSMFQSLLEDCTRIVGEEHDFTLTVMSNWASAIEDQGKLDESVSMQLEVLEKRIRIFGEDHTATLVCKNDLACTYLRQGQLGKAVELFQELDEKNKRIRGEDDPETITTKNNLAAALRDQRKLKMAVSMHQDVLEKRKRILGEGHEDTIMAMNDLALSYLRQGRGNEALPLQQEALEKARSELGDEHRTTILVMQNLVTVYRDQYTLVTVYRGEQYNLEEAIRLQREVVEKKSKTLGERHVETANAKQDQKEASLILLKHFLGRGSVSRLDHERYGRMIYMNTKPKASGQ